MNWIVNFLCGLPAIILAIGVHEYAHAKVADSLGDNTPRLMGRVTLDPFVHIDILGLVCLAVMGFGWGKPVRTNPGNFKNPRRGSMLVALAGPLSNLCLALIFQVVLILFYRFAPANVTVFNVTESILTPFVTWNILLFAFNLFPVPPLDGYHVLEGILGARAPRFRRFMKQYGIGVLILLSLLGVTGFFISIISGILQLPMLTLANLIL
ncbi:MAG: site-2 protease family protein [Christensenellales bacterium]